MSIRVLSLDVSASSTGWAIRMDNGNFEYGLIKTDSKFGRAERLAYFRSELQNILIKFKPTHVVMEDVYSGLNPKTLILLSKFAGIAEECCFSFTNTIPHIIHTNTVKSYFKAKTKEEIFYFITEIFDWDDGCSFKKHNDMTDALAQLVCYYDHILNHIQFRFEKEYGYLYEIQKEK
jgi:Holliday junction resolvasome RuvABC endonuclease subunit